MIILVSGAGGLVGRALCTDLRADGHEVLTLGRGASSDIQWDPMADVLSLAHLSALDAVVHLAGEPVAGGRWTAARKERILQSRVKGTELLVRRVIEAELRPQVFVSASGTSFYGDDPEGEMDESQEQGEGFLAEVCRQWEAACEPMAAYGVRVVHCRLGMVLARDGGALAKMMPAFRMGLGGRLGSGAQGVSWVSLRDVIAVLRFMIDSPDLSGPVNVVAPGAVSNRAFTAALGVACRRPCWFPVPALLLRLLFGEMADALLLSGATVRPQRLESAGFRFSDPELSEALRRIIG